MNARTLRRVASGGFAALALAIATVAPTEAARPRPDRTPPTQPANLRVTSVSTTTVSLAWNPSTDNVGVSYYLVTPVGGNNQAVTPPTTTATVSMLQPGETVTIWVNAFDANFNMSPTASVTVTSLADTTSPTAPSGLSVVGVQGSSVVLHWTSAVDDSGPAGITHQVLVDGVPTPNAMSTIAPGSPPPPSRGAYVRQLTPGSTPQFSVRAVDRSGNVSGTSNVVSAAIPPNSDTVAPTTPTLTQASDAGTHSCPEELELRWTAASDNVVAPSAIEYEVRINGVINDVFRGWTSAISYSEVFGANTVTIVAVDPAGNASPPSNARTTHVQWGSGCEWLGLP